MSVVHRITGYDKRTQRLAVEHDIPIPQLPKAVVIAKVPSADSDAIGSYPLEPDQARSIARLANTTVDVYRYDWFLEPFSESVDVSLN